MLLNGNWICTVRDDGGRVYTIPATVPGCVHTDLQAAGILPENLYWRDTPESCQWVENCEVTYERTFTSEWEGEEACLVFDGLDVYATVYLNGERIGEADDMFIPWTFPTKGALRRDSNTLTVVFRSPIKEVASLPPLPGAFTTERLYTRRVQCAYGWDWLQRFVTMGIWKDVYLEPMKPDRLESVYVQTLNVNPYTAQVLLRADFSAITGDGWATFTVKDPDGQTVYTDRRRILPNALHANHTRLEKTVDIPAPKLWYPAGYGEQPLYTLHVSVEGGDTETVSFGIRTVVILEQEDAPDSPEAKKAKAIQQYGHLQQWDHTQGSSGFILLINGVRIFCRGANWVPCEPFPSAETSEKLERLVALAREGNFNMLRVWGGGIFEHDAFYHACDRLGILVTQDFLMACGTYPEADDAFIEKISAEARAAALRLRNHPCLVWWSGDNENAILGDVNQPAYNGRRVALEGIAPVLAELDPGRRFLPSSPYGGVPYASAVRGTTHNTQFLDCTFAWIRERNFVDYRRYFEQYLARFTAEQPAMGMPYVSSMRKFMTEEDIFGEDDTISRYHTKNNPGLPIYELYDYVDILTAGIFGDYTSGEDRVRKMQMLHCERIRLSLELFRRNMWFSSGIIYWMFEDCWPAANSWSMIDYYAAPKPGFYTFKRCAAPVISSVTCEEGAYRAYISNAGATDETVAYRLYVYDIVSGEECTLSEGSCASPAGSATVAVEIDQANPSVVLDNTRILLCDMTTAGGQTDRSFFLPLRWGDMAWRYVEPRVETAPDGRSITVTAVETTPVLLLDLPCRVDKNSQFLKRGEQTVLRVVAVVSED